MKKTVMQDLKEDLIISKVSAKNSLSIIKDKKMKDACMKVVDLTLNSIIKRIDDELLEMEKQQREKDLEIGFHTGRFYQGREGDTTLEQLKEKTFKSE